MYKKYYIAVLLVVAIVGVGAYQYFAQPIAPLGEDVTTAVQQLSADMTSTGTARLFRIVPELSKVEFSLYEELFGQPKTVIGTTNQVTGDILIDQSDRTKTQVGIISVDARTLQTDSQERNGAIAGFILRSDQPANQFIIFTPTAVIGLPTEATLITPFSFKVTGNLTISGVTKEITFDVTLNKASDQEISGHGQAVVQRADYGLTIPNIPFVANVGEPVTLRIDFIAQLVEE